MKKIFIHIVFLGLVFNGVSQNFYKDCELNINRFDVNSKTKWYQGYLQYQDVNEKIKSKIVIVDNMDSWYDNSFLFVLRPTFFDNPIGGHLFNLESALIEEGICPTGYSLPKWSDLFSGTEVIYSKNGTRAENNNLHVEKTKIIEDFDASFWYDNNENACFWIDSTWVDTVNNVNGYYAQVNSSNRIEIRKASGANGYPIICRQNRLGNVLSETYSFHELLPKQFEGFIDGVSQILLKNFLNTDEQTLKFHLVFDKSGINNSRNFDFGGFSTIDNFKDEIRQEVLAFSKFPYVEKTPIPTNDFIEINQKLQSDIRQSKKLELVLSSFLSETGNNKEFENASFVFEEYDQLRAIYREVTIREKVYIGKNDFLSDQKLIKIEKLKSNGPLSAFWSVIPGLGMNHVMKNISPIGRQYTNQKKIKNTLLIGAISSGVIGLGAKLISDNYYSRYKSDRYGSNASSNYNIANASNKVFLSSSALYIALSLVDIGFTIPLGIEQKSVQKRINKRLRDSNGYILRK